jgi:NTE family protein
MDKQLAFVLSGGGSRGALQVGALYALLEHGFQPDLLVGTSIGAANAAFIARHGFSKHGLDELTAVWRSASTMDLLPTNYVWLTVRAMFGRSASDPSHRIRNFIIANGITSEMRFSEFKQPRLVIVSADLNTGTPVLHGEHPDDKILEALLISTALPPWSMPVKKQDQYLMDGGVESNLPIEPALKCGATKIVALDLMDTRGLLSKRNGVGGFVDRLIIAMEKRHADLELELAKARGVPILLLDLVGESPVPLWDFRHTEELIAQGYKIAQRVINDDSLFNP